ncbi:N-acetyltransferase [Aestuariivirga litoralis]|uniref:N-acetyltransferase n=1 Tax=Aestuariivirga litoralis TaxID=2650924 RepID=A0A2W2BQ44_9HYPH|nr:GNAT family N-acetyltransferase [Aestuariivirga litoralis]PZF75516.1 N-acetyltransferase [Aestuariivirga litoralis]
MILHTPRLTLSPCRPEDGRDFIALEHDPDVMRHLTGGRVGAQVPAELAGTYLQPRGGEPHVWTARRNGAASFVGWFCLWPETDQHAELGYRLRRDHWGQGLASEGAAALVGWGFGSAGYQRITGCTMAANHASRRVLEKAGLRHVRTLPAAWAAAIPDGAGGEVHYEITRGDWIAQSA